MEGKLNWERPLWTGDGRKARFLGTRKTLGTFTHIVAVEGARGQEEEFVHYFREDGTYPYGDNGGMTLVNEPERITRWTVIHENPQYYGYDTSDEAMYHAKQLIGYHVVRVEFEDGKPVGMVVEDD